MKILLCLSFIVIINTCMAQKQDGILMKPTLLPNLIYQTTVLTENNTIIEYVDNDDIINNLKAKGIEYPITSNTRNLFESTMRTGQINEQGQFTIKSTYDKVETELTGSITKLKKTDSSIKKLQGARAYGKVDKEYNIEIDSITNLKDESFRTTIEQGMKAIINQIEYPKEQIQIGKSFTIETPVKFPAGNGTAIDMIITDIYLLDSVSNNIAYFSIDQNIKVETSLEQTDLIVEGKGNGVIEYNLINKSNRLYYTELSIYSEVEVSGFKVKTKALTKSKTTTQIRKPDDNK